MKICWDNLEKLEYIGNNIFRYKTLYKKHLYKIRKCETCKEDYLGIKNNNSKFCNHKCKYNSQNYIKTLSIAAIKKLGNKNSNWKGGITENNLPFYDTYAHQISFCEEVRRNKKDLDILEVKCAYCGKWFIPTTISIKNRTQALNGKNIDGVESRLYCSTECKKECPIYNQKLYPKGFKPATSREVQPELRQMCFERDDYTCQKCGKHQDELDVGLHCHHVEGIRWEPIESADLDKVITFCKNCHIEVHKQPDCGYNDLKCKE